MTEYLKPEDYRQGAMDGEPGAPTPSLSSIRSGPGTMSGGATPPMTMGSRPKSVIRGTPDRAAINKRLDDAAFLARPAPAGPSFDEVRALPGYRTMPRETQDEYKQFYYDSYVARTGKPFATWADEIDPGVGEKFLGGLKSGVAGLYSTAGFLGEKVGADEFAASARGTAEGLRLDARQTEIQLPHQEEGWGQALNLLDASFYKKFLFEQAPASLPAIAAAAIGAVGAAALAPAAVPVLTAAFIGSVVGMGGGSFLQSLGDAYDEYIEAHPQEVDKATDYALEKAGMMGALDAFMTALGPVGGAANPLRGVASGMVKGAIKEGAKEAVERPLKHAIIQFAVQGAGGGATQVADNWKSREVDPNRNLSSGVVSAVTGEGLFEAYGVGQAVKAVRKMHLAERGRPVTEANPGPVDRMNPVPPGPQALPALPAPQAQQLALPEPRQGVAGGTIHGEYSGDYQPPGALPSGSPARLALPDPANVDVPLATPPSVVAGEAPPGYLPYGEQAPEGHAIQGQQPGRRPMLPPPGDGEFATPTVGQPAPAPIAEPFSKPPKGMKPVSEARDGMAAYYAPDVDGNGPMIRLVDETGTDVASPRNPFLNGVIKQREQLDARLRTVEAAMRLEGLKTRKAGVQTPQQGQEPSKQPMAKEAPPAAPEMAPAQTPAAPTAPQAVNTPAPAPAAPVAAAPTPAPVVTPKPTPAPASLPPLKYNPGKKSTASTERGTKVETEMAIVEAGDLAASHDHNGQANPNFPEGLQPRDRTRAASQSQIGLISEKLNPDFLGESPHAGMGAPIVGKDGIVESGNGRIAGISLAYNKGKGKNYRAWLKDNAQSFGLDPAAVDGMKKPVLVRVRTSEMNPAERSAFVEDANAQPLGGRSPTELAMRDAGMLPNLESLNPSEDGDLMGRANENFRTHFMHKIIPSGELGNYLGSEGDLNKAGVARMKNAIYAKAYGDPELVERMAESTDTGMHNVVTALTQAANDMAKLRDKILHGTAHDVSLTPVIKEAIEATRIQKEAGTNVVDVWANEASNTSLFDTPRWSPEADQLLRVIVEYKRSAKKLATFFKNYVKVVLDKGHPGQGELLDVGPTNLSVSDAIAEARAETARQLDGITDDQGDLFGGGGTAGVGTGAAAISKADSQGNSGGRTPVLPVDNRSPEKSTKPVKPSESPNAKSAQPSSAKGPSGEAETRTGLLEDPTASPVIKKIVEVFGRWDGNTETINVRREMGDAEAAMLSKYLDKSREAERAKGHPTVDPSSYVLSGDSYEAFVNLRVEDKEGVAKHILSVSVSLPDKAKYSRGPTAPKERANLNALNDRAKKIFGAKNPLIHLVESIVSGGKDLPGSYRRGLITLAKWSADPNGVFEHEAFHHAMTVLFNAGEKKFILGKYADGTRASKAVEAELKRRKYDAAVDKEYLTPEERAAYAYQFFVDGQARTKGGADHILGRVADFAKKLWRTLTGREINSPKDIFGALDRGDYSKPGERRPIAVGPKSIFDKIASIPTNIVPINKVLSGAVYAAWEHMPERIKAGMESYYGETDEMKGARKGLFASMRKSVRGIQAHVSDLMDMPREEAALAYEWMQEKLDTAKEKELMKQIKPERLKKLMEIRKDIRRLGMDAVEIGQLSKEAFDRNDMAYLHRSYMKHEFDANGDLLPWRTKAKRILGDQYRGRGLPMNATLEQLAVHDPRLVPKSKHEAAKGREYTLYERKDANGVVRGKAWLPAGSEVPPKLRGPGWEANGGTTPNVWKVQHTTREGSVVMHRDFTKAERVAMGEIDDARYAIARTLLNMTHDLEVGNYFKFLSEYHDKATGERWAVDNEADIPEGHTVAEGSAARPFAAYKPTEWVRVPDTAIPKAGGNTFWTTENGQRVKHTSGPKVYGHLAGKLVNGPLWNDIRHIQGAGKITPDWYQSMLRGFKIAKTALSPKTHVNNVMANLILMDMADLEIGHLGGAMHTYIKAWRGDAEAKAALQAFEDSGSSYGNYASRELRSDILDPLEKIIKETLGKADPTEVGATMGNAKVMAAINGVWDALKAVKDKSIDAYQFEDNLFRFALFTQEQSKGASVKEAAQRAADAFLDYDINAPWVNVARQTALPFLAWTYRAAPKLLEILDKKPWKLMKLMAVAGGLNALGYAISGGDEQQERALMPEEYQQKAMGIIPRQIRMPWNDKRGDPVYLDIMRWIPAGDILMLEDKTAIPIPPTMMISGPLQWLGELLSNKNWFTGESITSDTNTKAENAAAVAKHLWRGTTPNVAIIPHTTEYDRLFPQLPDGLKTPLRALGLGADKAANDPFGREYPMAVAWMNTFGIKIASHPKSTQQFYAMLRVNKEVKAQESEIRRAVLRYSNGGIDKATLQKTIQDRSSRIKVLLEKTAAQMKLSKGQ